MVGPIFVTLAAAVPVALLIDHLFGEPPARWHPVVWMGHALGWAGKRVAPLAEHAPAGRDLKSFWCSVLIWCGLSAITVFAAWGLQWALCQLPWWLAAVVLGVCLKPLLAWRMLRSEVLAVEAALAQSLAAGRERLSWLVSRDVTQLTEAQVRESAIESLAENLNDSVLAPLFWFAVAGLPGAALYRFANTADAMWGYRTVRGGRQWAWAGKWAARADDVLNWLPARLTALLLWPAGQGAALWHNAGLTPSPNGGWPMGAMALSLGVRLGKPGVYTLNATGREPLAADVHKAVALAWRAVWLGGAWLAALAAWPLVQGMQP
ncbi:MAG: adenosylcobinamide-phosphate synthase CbiB [Burkholderiales bacterium]|nr:adenosylcobinamide-phosphate synthase CbiB [Burkholderiales bacterium]